MKPETIEMVGGTHSMMLGVAVVGTLLVLAAWAWRRHRRAALASVKQSLELRERATRLIHGRGLKIARVVETEGQSLCLHAVDAKGRDPRPLIVKICPRPFLIRQELEALAAEAEDVCNRGSMVVTSARVHPVTKRRWRGRVDIVSAAALAAMA